ncbi:MAG TPA: hypothetical protein VFN82_05320 [Solirubrobacterales bacterium]|nr:hypothetical protein [Solirubrobacterales bacterium]
MARQFGFAQFDLPGSLPLADGRYLARSPVDEGDTESVLVVQTLTAPARARTRRRRPRAAEAGAEPAALPLTRVTAIRASTPFGSAEEAGRWLEEASEAEDTVDVLLAQGIALLNRALHARAVAAGDPAAEQGVPLERASGARIGFGSGEETASGRFAAAREIELGPRSASRRRRREEELRPQERLGALLAGRERLAACETLLLRAHADLEAGRWREAALQLRVGLPALLAELGAAAGEDDGHRRDLAELSERQPELESIAEGALRRDLEREARETVQALLATCERVLRRRRVLQN